MLTERKKQLRAELRFIANKFRVELHCHNTFKGGMSAPWKSMVIIGLKGTRNDILCAFFHELGHIRDFRDHKFRKYNGGDANNAYHKKVGIRAERHADRTGKAIMRVYYPKEKYYSGYQTERGKKALRDYYGNPLYTNK